MYVNLQHKQNNKTMKKILFAVLAIVIMLTAITCSQRDDLKTDNSVAISSRKPIAGNYIVTTSQNGYTLNITIDQSKAQATSHLLLQVLDCFGNYLDGDNVVSSSVPLTFTTGVGTGCAFNNSYSFIKFDNLDMFQNYGVFTISITFNVPIQSGNILIKSATNCFPFPLNITPNCNVSNPGKETAYAYGGSSFATCFRDLGFSRWGWTNGAYTEGDYTLDLYAGAGKCDLSKGTKVGSVTLSYHDGKAIVNYNVTAPYTLEETHLYVGNNKLYPGAVAPGLSPYSGGNSFTINNLSGSVYIIAHAVVGGF